MLGLNIAGIPRMSSVTIFQSDHFVLSTNFLFKFNVSLPLVTGELLQNTIVNVIYEPCHWFSCFCAFSKVTVNVLDVIVVRKLSPSKLLCLPPHLID